VRPDPAGEFTRFYKESRDDCLRAVVVARGSAHAEELLADAYSRAWARWSKVSRHPAPRAWVVRTALNAAVSQWRKRRREAPLDGGHDAIAPDAETELDDALLRIVRRLPRRQREVIALRVFLDLDTETTARALRIAPGTVTAHMARAVATLRREANSSSQWR
jgi:RNA polymerase sigma factor (sigma-70 family)